MIHREAKGEGRKKHENPLVEQNMKSSFRMVSLVVLEIRMFSKSSNIVVNNFQAAYLVACFLTIFALSCLMFNEIILSLRFL